MKVIAITNQKGGVAKTTTAASFGYELAKRGYKTLLIDCDPQADLSFQFNVDVEKQQLKSMYDVLCGKEPLKNAIVELDENLHIAPADILLAGAEQEISRHGKELRLKERIEEFEGIPYDYIIIDTPTSLGILNFNAYAAADEVIIPSTAGAYSLRAFIQLSNTISTVKKYYNPNLVVAGVLITRYNPNTKITKLIKQMSENIGEQLNTKIFNTYIRIAISVEEAQWEQIVINEYSNKSTVAQDYKSFVDEYLES